MKACPGCCRLFAVTEQRCTHDGTVLQSAGKASIPEHTDDRHVGRVLLGRFRVFRLAAEGGMGRVYEALDESGQRPVALKALHPELTTDSVSVQRFAREYEAGTQLPHPHIVEVLDFGAMPDGSQVLVMEWLHGEELRGLLKRERRLAPARLLRLLSQVALAVDFAHSRNWVHRDLKPDNLFLQQRAGSEHVKILDFGSAKTGGASKQLTLLGTLVGSPFYMSPEQAQGATPLDHRTDVWSLAVIAYECLTGRLPFVGTNGPSILLQILTATHEAPSQHLPELPPPQAAALDRVFVRGLAKAAAERTPSAGQLVDQLGHALGFSGAHTVWAHLRIRDLAAQQQAAPQGLPPLLSTAAAVPHVTSEVVLPAQGARLGWWSAGLLTLMLALLLLYLLR